MHKHPIVKHLYSLLFTLAAVFGFAFLTAASAQAIECGVAQCSVDSVKRGVNTWTTPAPTNPSNPGNGEGGNNAPPKYVYSFTPCYRFIPSGGGQSVSAYPAPDVAGRYVCSFADGGSSSGGSGYTFFSCPPQGGKAANGRTTAYDAVTGDYAFFYCLYPTDASFNPVISTGKIYTGGEGFFYAVDNGASASQPRSSGILTDGTGYRSTGFNAANPKATPNLNQEFNAKTGLRENGTPLYSYYRLKWDLDYKLCTETVYPPLFNKPSTIVCGDTQREMTAEPYTYSCELNPALQAGVIDASFKPSACADESWDCSVAAEISINGVTLGGLEVMRNGADVPTTHNYGQMPNLSGSGAVNARQWQYNDKIIENSSPANDNKRELWKQVDANGSVNRFDTWLDLRVEKQNMNTRFMWASDPVSSASRGSWAMTREYRFTADFIATTQAGIGSPSITQPITDMADCGSAKSPDVTVVRSINADTE